jgi:hypothetical protein
VISFRAETNLLEQVLVLRQERLNSSFDVFCDCDADGFAQVHGFLTSEIALGHGVAFHWLWSFRLTGDQVIVEAIRKEAWKPEPTLPKLRHAIAVILQGLEALGARL